jgi:hypothetical protein
VVRNVQADAPGHPQGFIQAGSSGLVNALFGGIHTEDRSFFSLTGDVAQGDQPSLAYADFGFHSIPGGTVYRDTSAPVLSGGSDGDATFGLRAFDPPIFTSWMDRGSEHV